MEDKEQFFQDKYFKDSELLTLKSIASVNHKPHVYVIGPKHIAYASDHCGGILGKETCEKVGCAHPGCNTSYDEHTSETVMFIQLKKDCKNQEINDFLKTMVEDMELNKIDGIVFIDTTEKFRIKD